MEEEGLMLRRSHTGDPEPPGAVVEMILTTGRAVHPLPLSILPMLVI